MDEISLGVEPTDVVARWVSSRLRAGDPDGATLAVLFGGDRLFCCDEVVVARDDAGQIIGLASIAPTGEAGAGPAIVGLYVQPVHRRQGVGTALLRAAVTRMVERDLTPIHVDLLGSAITRLVERVPFSVAEHLIIRHQAYVIDALTNH